MEKFLWNLAGVVLAVGILLALAYFVVARTITAFCVLIFAAGLVMIYADKRPVWLGV